MTGDQITYVTPAMFATLATGISCASIAEKQQAVSFKIGSWRVVITGAMGTGTGTGWQLLWGYKVQPLAHYTDALPALGYQEHHEDVVAGNRARGYTGMKIKCAGEWVVLVGDQMTFKPFAKTDHQLQLFT
jgi:hypothetical protein